MRKIFYTFCIIFLLCSQALAVQIPAGQDMGAALKNYTDEKEKKEVFQRLTRPINEPPALDEVEIEELPNDAESIYIAQIVLQMDDTVRSMIDEPALLKVTEEEVDKELSLEDMKELAMSITNICADKKVKVYIPKQNFSEGKLYINVVK